MCANPRRIRNPFGLRFGYLYSVISKMKDVIPNRRRRVRNLRLAGPARMRFLATLGMTMPQKKVTEYYIDPAGTYPWVSVFLFRIYPSSVL